jgi:Asp/Glu/hydantoin racemase
MTDEIVFASRGFLGDAIHLSGATNHDGPPSIEGPDAVPAIKTNIATLGLADRRATVAASRVRVLALHTDNDSGMRVAKAARQLGLPEDTTLVLGCASVTVIAGQMRARLPNPIIEPVQAAAHLAAAVVANAPAMAPEPVMEGAPSG